MHAKSGNHLPFGSPASDPSRRNKSYKILAFVLIMVTVSSALILVFHMLSASLALDEIVSRCIDGNESKSLLDFGDESIEFLRSAPTSSHANANERAFDKFFETFTDKRGRNDKSHREALSYLQRVNVDDRSRSINRTITPIVSR